MSRKRHKPCTIFWESNFPGVFRCIFSFIEKPTDCLALGLTQKFLWEVFNDMLNRSSVMRYRWNRLHSLPVKPYTRPYKGEIINIENEPNLIPPIPYKCHLDRNVWNAMAEMNQEYHSKGKQKPFFVAGGSVIGCAHPQELLLAPWTWKNQGDIDVFVLGKNKSEVLSSLLVRILTKRGPFYTRRKGDCLLELYLHKLAPFSRMNSKAFEIFKKKYQFILMAYHDTPSDVFSFFDLDCCKVGVFPGNPEYVGCKYFERALKTRMNIWDLNQRMVGWGHMHRILKYVNRLGIHTTRQKNHPLSMVYHNVWSFVEYAPQTQSLKKKGKCDDGWTEERLPAYEPLPIIEKQTDYVKKSDFLDIKFLYLSCDKGYYKRNKFLVDMAVITHVKSVEDVFLDWESSTHEPGDRERFMELYF